MTTPPPLQTVPANPETTATKSWHCGTLLYTKAGLVSLFVFLLLGSFSFTLMMVVVPSILPLKLKSLGSSNTLISLLLSSVFPLFGMFISPYLSFKSDHLRTRWGRRMPFFFISLPFVTLSILFLAFSEDISAFLHRTGVLSHLSPTSATILVIGICIIAFQLSDVVIASVYNYIFNDTVPAALIGRFFGLVQMVSAAISFFYNYFIFKYAESHMKEIFICTALIYFTGIALLCIFVKEGEYPAVTEQERKNTRGISGIKTYFRESFSHKFYWTKFLYSMAPVFGAVLWPFNVFYFREMGLPDDLIGKASAVSAAASVVAAYFSSIFIDRWHPLRILAYSGVFSAVLSLGGWVWLFVTLPPMAFFWLHMLGPALIGVFHGALCSVSMIPLDIRLQPKSRYGQFCSAQSIIANISKVVAGVALGLFFDFFKSIFHGADYAYRFNFLWIATTTIAMTFVICSLYRQWQALGGDRAFNPPAPWSEKGYEEIERPSFVGTQSRWLDYAMKMFHSVFALTFLSMLPVTYWLWKIGWKAQGEIYLYVLVPVALVLYWMWRRVESALRADIARHRRGEATRNGIPHHGILFVKACVVLLGIPVALGMYIVSICNGMHTAIIVFGLGTQITNAMVILAVVILRRLERGNDPLLDEDSRQPA